MIALGVSVTAHLLAVAVLVALVATPAVRGFLPIEPHDEQHEGPRRNPLKAWTEPRTLLIGLFVFCMAFTEGTGVDWLGVAIIDGYDAAAALGSLTFAIFLGRDDARPLVRPGAARPLRPRAADPRDRR